MRLSEQAVDFIAALTFFTSGRSYDYACDFSPLLEPGFPGSFFILIDLGLIGIEQKAKFLHLIPFAVEMRLAGFKGA